MNCKFCESKNMERLLTGKGFKIFFCKDCEIASTYPEPVLPDYEQMDFHGNHTDKVELLTISLLPIDWQDLIYKQIKMVEKHVRPNSKVTEIGCGEGLLLTELKKSGYDTYGIEPSSAAVERSAKRNLSIDTGYFPSIHPKEKQDLFLMSHVLEHIKEPASFLDELVKWIVQGGYLILTQTNYKGLIPFLKRSAWYAWVPEQHFWHFTIAGLNKYLKKYNFHLVDYKYVSLVHPHNISSRIASIKESWLDQYIVVYKYIGS